MIGYTRKLRLKRGTILRDKGSLLPRGHWGMSQVVCVICQQVALMRLGIWMVMGYHGPKCEETGGATHDAKVCLGDGLFGS